MLKYLAWTMAGLASAVLGLGFLLYADGRKSAPGPAQYVAIGSSYASIVTSTTDRPGAQWLEDRDPNSPWLCARSRNNYAHQLARMRGLSLVDVSCAGATTRHVLRGGQYLLAAQLEALHPQTRLVTVTSGGNDIGYVGSMTASGCHLRTHLFAKLLQAAFGCRSMPSDERRAALHALPMQFDAIAAQVRRRSPQARLVFLSYQSVLPASGTCPRLGMTVEQAERMRHVATALATAVRDAASRNRALFFDAGAATAGHDVCSSQPWMSDQIAPMPLHPNLDGMRAIAVGLDRLLDANR